MSSPPSNFDEYAKSFDPPVRTILRKIRATILRAVPDAQERISYRMPAYKTNKDVAYFAAFQKHIGFYPPVRGDQKLIKEAAPYAGPKGNLQFPLDEPIPYALITKIVKAHAKLNLQATKAKSATKRKAKT
jgi:uncharacterized protein YdhG (YjbR/CyaY superfamily)